MICRRVDVSVPAPTDASDIEFNNLAMYEVSYMWFSAVACLWCIVVGVIISLFKPQVISLL